MSSCRCSIMIGGIMMTMGLAGSAFATGLDFLLGSFGIIAGIGLGLVYTPSIVAVSYYFEKRRSMATGIALSGSGAALLTYPFLFQFLMETVSLRVAFLIFAAISCHVCIAGSIIFPVLKERECACVRNGRKGKNKTGPITNTTEEKKSRFHQLRIFRSLPFVCLCLNLFLSNVACGIILVHFPAFVESKGTTDYGISEILCANGVALIVGRTLVGIMVHDHNIDELMVYIGSLSIAGTINVCFPLFGNSFATYIFYIMAMGMYFGSTHTLLTPLTIKFVGLDKLASAYGIEMVFAGSAYLISPPIAGWIVDRLHSYEYGIVLGGTALLLSIVFMFAIPLTEAYRSTKGYHLAPSGIHIADKELEIDTSDV